jgi:hypothetical protein
MMEESDRIRVRWLDIVPTRHNGMEMFLVRDPEGITDKSLLVSREALFLISLMDGTMSARDIQAAYMRASGELIISDRIASMVEALDAHFLLENARYRDRVRALKAEYEAAPCRSAYLAGNGYPGDEAGLRAFMENLTRQAEGGAQADGVRAIIAPHIDYARGTDVYRLAYGALPKEGNTLFVIFGTCHKVAPRLWNIALRDVATPLGVIAGAGAVGRLIREDALLGAYVDEWPHRNEHSIELQLPVIQYLLGGERFEVLSILTGSLHAYMEDGMDPAGGEAADLAGRLKEILKAHDGPCVFIAGADLAHIGAQFGDPRPLDRAMLDESRRKDERLLRPVAAADGAGFFDAVRQEGDRRRICGLAPIYFLLSMLDSCRGQVVGYDQWTDGASSVSFAGVVFFSIHP